MTPEEFIIWLNGYLDGKESEENPSLQKIREKIDMVVKLPINTTITTQPFIQPPMVDPYNPYKITCEPNGTGKPMWYTNSTVTTAKVDSTPTQGKQLLTENED